MALINKNANTFIINIMLAFVLVIDGGKSSQSPFISDVCNFFWQATNNFSNKDTVSMVYQKLRSFDDAYVSQKWYNMDKDFKQEKERELLSWMENNGLGPHIKYAVNKGLTKLEEQKSNPNDDSSISFNDEHLNSIWQKANEMNFPPEELNLLREEFTHYQNEIDKVPLISKELFNNAVNEDEYEDYNMIITEDNENEEIIRKVEHKQRIKERLEHLEKYVKLGPMKEFNDSKIKILWEVATTNNLSDVELRFIKSELSHFEERLVKLRELRTEHNKLKKKYAAKEQDKSGRFGIVEEELKKQEEKVEIINEDLKKSIYKHTEL